MPKKSPGEKMHVVGSRVDQTTWKAIHRFMKDQKVTHSDAIRILLSYGIERIVPPKEVDLEDALVSQMKAVRVMRQAMKNAGLS